MSSIAFVGPKQYHLSFSFLGAHCFSADKSNAPSLITRLKEEGYTIVFTTEDIVSEGGDGVVVLPGMISASRQETIKKEIRRAIGSDISSFLKS